KGAPPILVVGTTRDPATPYSWAVAVSQQLESATLLTHEGEGHTAYRNGDGCTDIAVDDYLLDLKVPAKGTICGDATRATPIQVGDQPVAIASATSPSSSKPSSGGSNSTQTLLIIGLGVFVVVVGGGFTAALLLARRRERGG